MEVLVQLVKMSRLLGQPEWDCVILGEGNTSARVDEESFYVKASGHQLPILGPEGFVRVRFRTLLDFLYSRESSDEAVTAALATATIEPQGLRPSVETLMHAYLLSFEDVKFVGHTHPTVINGLLCSQRAEELVKAGRLTAEEVVLCGAESCWVPYTDPGIGLARAVRDSLEAFLEKYGQMPRQILVQNHGLIAPGRTTKEVETTTQMAVKAARILAGTMAFGGPSFLPEHEIQRLMTRPDEAVRLRKLGWAESRDGRKRQ